MIELLYSIAQMSVVLILLFFSLRIGVLERRVKKLIELQIASSEEIVTRIRVIYINQLFSARDKCVEREDYEQAAKFDSMAKREISKIKDKQNKSE